MQISLTFKTTWQTLKAHGRFPPVKWTQQRGLFSSFIHLNFKGSELAAQARNLFKFVDDNGFVTSNVIESLLAARELGVEIDENVFDMAVEGILGHQDKNSLPNEIVFNFWNQVCANIILGLCYYTQIGAAKRHQKWDIRV